MSQLRSDTDSVIDCSEPASSRRPSTKHRRNDTRHRRVKSDGNDDQSNPFNSKGMTKLVFIPRKSKQNVNQIADAE